MSVRVSLCGMLNLIRIDTLHRLSRGTSHILFDISFDIKVDPLIYYVHFVRGRYVLVVFGFECPQRSALFVDVSTISGGNDCQAHEYYQTLTSSFGNRRVI